MPEDRPVSLKARAELAGAHYRVRLWAGRQPGSRGLCGELVFREDEWPFFRRLLQDGAERTGTMLEVEEGEPERKVPGRSTLEHLFRPGEYVFELDDADFGELVEIVMENAEGRGITLTVNEEGAKT